MSKKRHRSVRDVKVQRGPNGRRLCTYCRVEVKPPRRTFCSAECVHQHRIRSDSGYASDLVFERDLGICSLCGIDTVKRQQDARIELRDTPSKARTTESAEEWMHHWDDNRRAVIAAWKATGWPTDTIRRWWEMDHVVPVVEGGGECGLDNLRTVCCPCHKGLTKALAQKRAQERKAKKEKNASPDTPPASGEPGAGS